MYWTRITIAKGMILLSRNLFDFERVPSLGVEDWTT
jgi:predicted nucleic acid-binding protein